MLPMEVDVIIITISVDQKFTVLDVILLAFRCVCNQLTLAPESIPQIEPRQNRDVQMLVTNYTFRGWLDVVAQGLR